MSEHSSNATGAGLSSSSKPQKRGWIRKLTVAGLGLAVTILAGEIGLRIGGYTPRYVNILATFHTYDPELGFVGRSGIEGTIHSPEFQIEMNYTAEGFRRVDAQNPSANRVLYVLGDSFAWGAGVDATLCDRIARRTTEWNVKNYSLPGFGTLQEQRVFERYVRPNLTSRDAVLIVHYGNDFDDNLGKHLTNLPYAAVSQTGTIEIIPPPHSSWLSEVRNSLKRDSYLWNYIAYKNDYHKLDARVERLLDEGPQESIPDTTSPEFASLPTNDPRMIVMRDSLARIESDCDERGVPLFIIRVPNREEFGEANVSEARRQEPCLVYAPSIRAVTRELKIPLIDLLDPFEDWKSRHAGRLTFPGDLHWNETAHELTATTVLDYLERQLIPTDRIADESATNPVSRR